MSLRASTLIALVTAALAFSIFVLYGFFPFGTAFLITPAVWLYEQAPESFCNLLSRANCGNPSPLIQLVELEEVFASLIVSFTGLLLFIASRRVAGAVPALASMLCFYFLTPS